MSERVGPYELRGTIGQGGMGTIHRAWDPGAKREVALKLLTRVGEQQRRRFQREARAIASLRHRNVLTVLSAGETEDGRPYLVLDLIDGPSLEEVLRREGPLPVRRAVEVAWHLAQGLAHAHERGVLHRDLKPANVLLTADGRPLLTDFGLAKDLDTSQTRLTRSGHALGTPGYWPPEQARGDLGAVGPASDVYGLGAVLYALLTGEPPVDGDTLIALLSATLSEPPRPPSALRAEVDPALDALVLRCLEKDPQQRFPSASALADALDAWLLGAPRRRPAWALPLVVGAVVLAATLGVGAAWVVARPPASTPAPPAAPAPVPVPAPEPEPASVSAAPALWRLAPGSSLRLRLTRTAERVDTRQSMHLELVLTLRLLRLEPGEAQLELDVERVVLKSMRGELPVLEFDSAVVASAEQRELSARVRTLLASHPQVLLDPVSGRPLGVQGVPTLTPDDPHRGAGEDLIAAILGVVSNQGLHGCFQTLWHVVPPGPPDQPWQVEGQVWGAGALRYQVRRAFKPRGERVVVSARASANDAVLPRTLNQAFRLGPLELRGEVRFSERGLEASRMVLDYVVEVGDYPGARRTTLACERLD